MNKVWVLDKEKDEMVLADHFFVEEEKDGVYNVVAECGESNAFCVIEVFKTEEEAKKFLSKDVADFINKDNTMLFYSKKKEEPKQTTFTKKDVERSKAILLENGQKIDSRRIVSFNEKSQVVKYIDREVKELDMDYVISLVLDDINQKLPESKVVKLFNE